MFIDRFRYQATKASQVQSRIKMLEKVVPVEVPAERKKIHFDFPTCGKSGRTVLELKGARKAYGEHVVFGGVHVHIERGDRIALVGPNGTGKSTLMRMLSGEEAPDSGERVEGHNIVMQYFAQDEAARMDPNPTVYETLASGSPMQMVPAIRNILGGFLFSGDDVYKRVRVLSGGERTRLAVARMLLRPSNVLLLDEPTNHLDLDSKEVLLDALVDYGGTLVFVSHDRYFVERLATKIIEIAGPGHGDVLVYPGTYKEFLWHKEHPSGQEGRDRRERQDGRKQREQTNVGRVLSDPPASRVQRTRPTSEPQKTSHRPAHSHEEKKRVDAAARKRERAAQARQAEIDALEKQVADCEAALRELEQTMASPGFYENREAAQPIIDRHQALMWQTGDLMHRWEKLQSDKDLAGSDRIVI
jgi:ATP-binding cassette subfamily F protein 3